MLRHIVSTLLVSTVVCSTAYAAEATDGTQTPPSLAADAIVQTEEATTEIAKSDAHGSGAAVDFNPADPAFWAKAINPETHGDMHMAMMNPAQHKQMMKPQFYMQMMNPAVWAKWMNPETVSTLANPAMYMGWMQPSAYTHVINPEAYQHMMNPAAYTDMLSAETFNEFFNPNAYTDFGKVFSSQQGAATESTGGATFFDWFKTASLPVATGDKAAQ